MQLQKELPNVQVVPIERKVFNEAQGFQKLKALAAEEFGPIVQAITNKYYCLSSCCALLKYIELVHPMIFAPKSLRIVFQGSDQTCMIGKYL